MWDDGDTGPVQQQNAFTNSSGGGFYIGRGRGFGGMDTMSKALPTVGGNHVSNGSTDNSGWQDDSGWDDTPASNTDGGFGDGGNKYDRGNSYGNQQNRDTRSKLDYQNGWNNNRSRFNKGSNCFKCNQEGHMSRECPNSGGGGGRACYKCGQEGHMSRECPSGSGGGGRACHKCGEEGHMARECPSGGSSGGGRACHKCGEEGHMARECPSGGSSGGGGRACHKCGEEGHMARECPSGGSGGGGGRACHKCGEEGHMARECPSGGSGGGGGRACHKCGEEGHMARECPTGGGGKCYKCQEEGHMARECPNAEPVLGEDGKPRPPIYIPPDVAEDQETLFQCTPAGINFDKYDKISVDVSGDGAPPPIRSFEDSNLCQLLLKNVSRCNYTRPTPVQKYAIPIIAKQRDLMACAQTGSGKTAAFLLPILNEMIPNPDLPNNAGNDEQEPWAVIIAPTRELVIQIGSEAKKFAYDSVVKAEVLYGGTSTGHQTSRIRRGAHIIVATPGRLLDFVEKGKVSFSKLKYLILDEADRMLDMGFAPDIRKMVENPTMPEKGVRRTLMFSATFPEEIQKLAAEYLDNYLFLTVGMVGAANSDVEQSFFNVSQYEKREKLLEILQVAGTDRTLVFVEQKRIADFVASFSSQNDIPTTSIHGDRLQKEREEALRDFRSGKMHVLVATAVAARGLDIKGVKHVINYDLPKTVDEYVHRIGRTGRVGNTGKATSFYDASVDQPIARSLKKILIDANQEIPEWLAEEANQASGTVPQYGGRGNFNSRDVRNQGRTQSSNDAYDNNFSSNTTNYEEPVNEDDGWD